MRKRSTGFWALAMLLVFSLRPIEHPEPGIENLVSGNLQAASDNSCSVQNTAFQGGEEITYKMYYNWKFVWVAAGEVTFRVKDLGEQYYFSAIGRTYRSYDPFFKVRDTYECYVDKKTMLPTVAIRQVEEGKYRLYDQVTFDRKRKVARSLRGKSKETAQLREYPIDHCIHDILWL